MKVKENTEAGASSLDDDRNRVLDGFLFLLNILFYTWYCIFTIVIAVVVLPSNYVYYRAWKPGRLRLAARRFIQLYGRCTIRLSWPMVRVRIENRKEIEKVDPCVYVLNHFSFSDVFFCGFLPGYQTVVAVRSWPFKIPIMNILMRIAGYMDVQENPWEDTLSYAAKVLKSGCCLLFFPEGHRSRNGKLQPLGKGAFRIAAENDVPIVPVTLEGTEYLAGYKSRRLRSCRVRMRFYPPMRAGGRDFAAVNDLRQRVEDLYLVEVYDKQPVNRGLNVVRECEA